MAWPHVSSFGPAHHRTSHIALLLANRWLDSDVRKDKGHIALLLADHWLDSDGGNKGHMCYNRSKNSGPCGRPGELFGLGAQHYPQLVARMREIGAIIRGNNPAPKPPPEYEPTAKCECVAATKYVCVEATKKCELSQRGLETKLECGETCGKPKPKPPAPAPVAAKYVCSKAAKKCVESRDLARFASVRNKLQLDRRL